MSEWTCYLITVLYGDQLLRCALKTMASEEYPMEPEARARLHAQLPLHVRTCHPDCFFEVWPHDGEVIIDSDIPAWNRRSDGY